MLEFIRGEVKRDSVKHEVVPKGSANLWCTLLGISMYNISATRAIIEVRMGKRPLPWSHHVGEGPGRCIRQNGGCMSTERCDWVSPSRQRFLGRPLI